MPNSDNVHTLWSALYGFKKEHYAKQLKKKISEIKTTAKAEPTENQRAKEIEGAREILSDFIIKTYSDLDFISKTVIANGEIDPYWEKITSMATASFKDWIDSSTFELEKKTWHGTKELQNNIDDFLDRASKYHAQVQKIHINKAPA